LSVGQTVAVSREHPNNNRPRTLIVLLALLGALALLASACTDDSADGSDSSGEESGDSTGSEGESARSPGAPEVPEECEDEDASPGLAAAEERGEPDESVIEGVEVGEPQDLAEGDGDEVITDGTIEIHYAILNASDGSVVDSSWQLGQPQQGPVATLPPPFAEAIEGMKVGGRRVVTLPATELYGGEVPPDSGIAEDGNLSIVVDLVSVSEAGAEEAGADEGALAAAEERGAPEMSVPDGTADTEELVVIDDLVGDGQVVCPGDQVVAHYTGIQASDGEQFDSSWDRGEPTPFGLDQVIQGWSEGLVGMKVGGRRTLVIPSDLAYGDDGDPAGVLVFTVDLVGVG
jgi:peptidylprolyl isomerase